MSGESPHLRRVLRLPDVVLFFVVAVVGLRWIATAAAVGPSAIGIWIAALVTFFVPLGFAVVELASRSPEEGGIYVWTKRMFGDATGFMVAWLYWASNLVYMPGLLYFGAANVLFALGPSAQHLATNPFYFILFSLAGLGLALWLNVIGAGVGKWLANLGGIATWIPAAVLVGLAALACAKYGSVTRFAAADLVPRLDLGNALLWSTIAFGFAGLEAASLMGEEIEDAPRTVPRAILIAGVTIAAIYILGTIAVLVSVPVEEVNGLAGILQAIYRVAERGGWGAITPAMALLVAFGSLGGASAWLSSTSRLPFVAGLDRYLPPAFGRLHPRWGTPYVALAAQAAGAGVIAILGQAGASVKSAYDVLVGMGVITYFVPYLVLFAAYARIEGPYRTPGGRPAVLALAALGALTTLTALVLAALPTSDAPNKELAVLKVVGGSAVLAVIGAWIYARGASRSARGETPGE